jgi:hypothetical protein
MYRSRPEPPGPHGDERGEQHRQVDVDRRGDLLPRRLRADPAEQVVGDGGEHDRDDQGVNSHELMSV